MHVDGFRFDLAATLARQDGGFSRLSAFFDLVEQDPVVSRAKMVAEPWDVGQMDSYDLGRFPALWREWNGKYRDTIRDFWRSHPVGIGEFANRFTGSSDLYATAGRRPTASVNLITVHDGFTIRDLGSYDAKQNQANGENNLDWASADTALLDYTRHLIAFRRAHPVFRRRRFLAGTEAAELQWFTPAGTPMD